MTTQDDIRRAANAQGKQQRGLKPRKPLPFRRRATSGQATARGMVVGISAIQHVDEVGNEIEFAQGTGVHKI